MLERGLAGDALNRGVAEAADEGIRLAEHG